MMFYLFLISLKKIAEQDSGKYEAAVYAAQCSNLKRMLPVCTDWEVCQFRYYVFGLVVIREIATSICMS